MDGRQNFHLAVRPSALRHDVLDLPLIGGGNGDENLIHLVTSGDLHDVPSGPHDFDAGNPVPDLVSVVVDGNNRNCVHGRVQPQFFDNRCSGVSSAYDHHPLGLFLR